MRLPLGIAFLVYSPMPEPGREEGFTISCFSNNANGFVLKVREDKEQTV
jgi:hypothetical protein